MRKSLIVTLAAVAAVAFAVFGVYRAKTGTVSGKTDIYTALPSEPVSIIRINNLIGFTQGLLYNNSYWHDLSLIDGFSSANEIMQQLDSLKENDEALRRIMSDRRFVIASFRDTTSGNGTLICSQISKSDWETVSTFLNEKTKRPYFFAYVGDIMLASTDKKLVDKASAHVSEGTSVYPAGCSFRGIEHTASEKAAANWFINSDQAREIIAEWIGEDDALASLLSGYSGYLAFDIETGEDNVSGNGFVDNSQSDNLLHIFKGQNTNENTLVNAMSYNTFFFRHFAIDDLEKYRQNLLEYNLANDSTRDYSEPMRNLESTSGETPLIFFQDYFAGEIVAARNPMGRYIIAKLSNGTEAAARLLAYAQSMPGSETRKTSSHEIIYLGHNGFVSSVFGDIFALPAEFLVVDNDNLIVAANPNIANYIATRNPQTQTLQCSPVFRQANNSLLTSSNQTIYYDLPYMVRNSGIFISKEKQPEIERYKKILANIESIGMQTQAESENLDYQHIYIQYGKKAVASLPVAAASEPVEDTAPVKEDNITTDENDEETETDDTKNKKKPIVRETRMLALFTAKTDAPITLEPQFLSNHYTGETEILVQDSKNQIYLFNNKGERLWKAQISEQIIGGVHQVDMLKNKKLQTAFVTKTKFYIIDRNGKCLTGYPKTLPTHASGQLAVFDYDNNLNYRFVYPTTKRTLVVMKENGTVPPDFKSPTFEGVPEAIPQLFRLGGKDYIVVNDGHGLHFLDRKGNCRFKTAQKIHVSDRNLCYSDGATAQSHFIAAATDGTIYRIKTDGTSSTLAGDEFGNNCAYLYVSNSSGIRHILYDSKKLAIYDKDMKTIMRNDDIRGGMHPTMRICDSDIFVHDTKNGDIKVFDITTGTLSASLPFSGTIFSAGRMKPGRGTMTIIVKHAELSAYLIEK